VRVREHGVQIAEAMSAFRICAAQDGFAGEHPRLVIWRFRASGKILACRIARSQSLEAGADNDAVLSEMLGLSSDQIAKLYSAGPASRRETRRRRPSDPMIKTGASPHQYQRE